jgi:glycosyltransferase involved in cell wall biosynthesis
MIGLLHGYMLEGSGSNLWTRAIVRATCRQGESVHLVCQENHPEKYDFISEAHRYHQDGTIETFFTQQTPYPGKAILHKPQIGATLPVYVGDRYEEFSRVVRMPDLLDEEIESYVESNVRVVREVATRHGVSFLHANHAVLMSVVAHRVHQAQGVPFAIMPHGSAIEYAVKKDPRMMRLAESAFAGAGKIFVVGPELLERVCKMFSGVPAIETKMVELNLGADTSLFEPLPQAKRADAVARLARSLHGVPRGRKPSRAMPVLEVLQGEPELRRLEQALQRASNYDGRRPDTDLESKLAAIDWEQDKVLLFVGRLIAAKGLHSILAAMPLILEAEPRTKLLVVGHGPMREVAEALVAALAAGRRDWVELFLQSGPILEGGAAARPLTEMRLFFDRLIHQGRLESYFEVARQCMGSGCVIFTGYLTHRELRFLFPCCDAAIFPSVVAEAGPLVFLEALACGCWPIGTYFAGMGASIDAVSRMLPPEAADAMKLRRDPDWTVVDIADRVPKAFDLVTQHKDALRKIAVEHYDWSSVARRWVAELKSM